MNRHTGNAFLRCVLKLVNKAINESDEEIRAIIPRIFKPFCDAYSSNIPILIDFYCRTLTKFISAQIQLGKRAEEGNMVRFPEEIRSEFPGKDIKN